MWFFVEFMWGKRKSTKEIIEKEKRPDLEQAYIKYPRGKLWKASSKRAPNSVKFDERIINFFYKFHREKPFTKVHTHTISPKELFGAIPSKSDLYHFLEDKKIKSSIIAQQDPKTGEFLGYTILRKTKKTPVINIKNHFKNIDEHFKNYESKSFLHKNTFVNTLSSLAEKYHFQTRFVPAKGYELDLKRATYVPKSKHILTEKVAVSIIGLSFLGAIFFLSSNMTGFAVSNFARSSNLIGIVLFAFGLIGVYFYSKRDELKIN